MTDTVSSAVRSRIMSAVRHFDTAPEMAVRRALHARGFRYRIHLKELPGRPDIVLTRWRTVIFVNGCFWHSHGCRASGLPATRELFWHNKIQTNKLRDRKNTSTLKQSGWRVLTVWECAVKRAEKLDDCVFYDRLAARIRKNAKS